ncbi:MAG TPA: histidine phosphatase family protein [Acidimicrobiia bacterium]|nr:histidine phosphatase family protein [Acidimicrobiia bacterium]
MKLLLIRHSEPDPGRDALDPPLTERGRQLATDTGQWLAGEEITAVYSSTTRRALETAALIAESVEAPVIQRDGLAEFGNGQEYVTVDELRRTGDPRWTAMAAGDLEVFGTDAETFRAEVAAAIGAIVDAHPGETVAVVAHAGVINAYLGGMLEIDRLLWVELDYAAICRVAISRRGVRSVLALNERPHCCGLPSSDSLLSIRLPGGTS